MRHSIRYSYSEVFILCYQTDCVVCSDLGFNLHINASLGSGGGSAGRRRVGDTLIINLNITLIEDDGTGDPEPLLSLGPIFYITYYNTCFVLTTSTVNLSSSFLATNSCLFKLFFPEGSPVDDGSKTQSKLIL